jgi:hypothetical protein
LVVHRYDENKYENPAPKDPTISLDIQDGKVYDFVILEPE